MITSPPLSNSCESNSLEDTELEQEMNSFMELPLKSSRCLSNNFSELLLEYKRPRMCSEPGVNREHRHVEELLQDASEETFGGPSELVSIMGRDMDKMDAFRSELLQRRASSRTRMESTCSVDATESSTTGGSLTNFWLGEVESEDEVHLEEQLKRVISKRIAESRWKREDNMGRAPFLTGECDSSWVFPKTVLSVSGGARASHSEKSKDSMLPTPKMMRDLGCQQHECGGLTKERALSMFKEDIYAVLALSRNMEVESIDKDPFEMRSTATVTYEQYLDRINEKCMFDPVVYLTADFLLLRLSLQSVPCQDKRVWEVKRPITEAHIHRVIAAIIRIATKILEDTVHSHDYFSRVCGISKKLLTKLEVTLLLALRDEGLMITVDRLESVVKTHQDLREQIHNMTSTPEYV